MKGFAGTVVSGAIGIAALFVVGKIAFQAGHDIAEAEMRYEQLQKGLNIKESKKKTIVVDEPNNNVDPDEPKQITIPEKKQSTLGMLFGLRKTFKKGGSSVIGNLLHDPENHIVEACVEGREIHVTVKPKSA